MDSQNFRSLKVWQLGMELAEQVYHLSQRFPRHETYGLGSQMQRAAVSIPANIAEGHAMGATKDKTTGGTIEYCKKRFEKCTAKDSHRLNADI